MKKLNELQSRIGYDFNDIELLKTALTHTSYANEHKRRMIKHNERLYHPSLMLICISEG